MLACLSRLRRPSSSIARLICCVAPTCPGRVVPASPLVARARSPASRDARRAERRRLSRARRLRPRVPARRHIPARSGRRRSPAHRGASARRPRGIAPRRTPGISLARPRRVLISRGSLPPGHFLLRRLRLRLGLRLRRPPLPRRGRRRGPVRARHRARAPAPRLPRRHRLRQVPRGAPRVGRGVQPQRRRGGAREARTPARVPRSAEPDRARRTRRVAGAAGGLAPELRLMDIDVPRLIRSDPDANSSLVSESDGDVLCGTVMRADLLRALAAKLPPDSLALGREVVEVEVKPAQAQRGSAMLRFADGSASSEPFDLVVGCDGIRGVVRSAIDPNAAPAKYSGVRIVFGCTAEDDAEAAMSARPEGSHRETHQWFGDGCYALAFTAGGDDDQKKQHNIAVCVADAFDPVARRRRREESGRNQQRSKDSSEPETRPGRKRGVGGIKGIVVRRVVCERRRRVFFARRVPRRSGRRGDARRVDASGVLVLAFLRRGRALPRPGPSVARRVERLRVGGRRRARHAPVSGAGREPGAAGRVVPRRAPRRGRGPRRGDKKPEIDGSTGRYRYASVAEALDAYEATRKPPTTRIALSSRLIGFVETGGGVVGLARDVAFAGLGATGVAGKIFLENAVPRL